MRRCGQSVALPLADKLAVGWVHPMRLLVFILACTMCTTTAAAGTSLNDFVLWDYRDGAPVAVGNPDTVSLPDYHQWLLTYLQSHPPPRLVLYVTDPCHPDPDGSKGWKDFYDPTAGETTATGDLTFIGFLKQANALVSDVSVFISWASFPPANPANRDDPPDPMNACWGGSPSGEHMEPSWLPAQFERLPNAMGWLEALMSNATLSGSNPVQSFCLDPEGSGGTPAYLQLLLWLDKYQSTIASAAVQALDIEMTLGFEAHTVTKVLVAELPAPVGAAVSNWPADLWTVAQDNTDLSSYATLLSANAGQLPWRTTTKPLLQRAALQVYSACIDPRTPGESTSAFWRWMTSNNDCACGPGSTYTLRPATDIAASLVNVMQRVPDACGDGTIAAVANGSGADLTGTGSFMPYMEGYSRLMLETSSGGTIPATGEWKYVEGTPPQADAMTVTGPSEGSGGQSLNYRFTEISIDFRAPPMTVQSPDRITLLFSVEKTDLYPFFGWGNATSFYAFIDAFHAGTQATDPASTVYEGQSGGLPVPVTAFGLYDLKQLCDNWGIAHYAGVGGSQCMGDLDESGAVGSADLLLLLDDWGTSAPAADLDGNGMVDVLDLIALLRAWGTCS